MENLLKNHSTKEIEGAISKALSDLVKHEVKVSIAEVEFIGGSLGMQTGANISASATLETHWADKDPFRGAI